MRTSFNAGRYAAVTSTLALVVALGGTGYAVTELPHHSVGTAQLKAGAVTSSKVKNGSLSAKDLKSGVVPKALPVKLTPIATFVIGNGATIYNQAHRSPVTGLLTASESSAGIYAVTLPGIDVYYKEEAVLCSTGNTGYSIVAGSADNNVLIELTNSSGTLTDGTASCVVYPLAVNTN